VFNALQKTGAYGFVRVCRQKDALWVSDCPRRTKDLSAAEQALAALEVRARLDEENRLWYLDLTERKWREMLQGLSFEMPCLPDDERLHPVFALCRLWLLHPHQEMALEPVRAVWKWMNKPEDCKEIRMLHEEAACALRQGKPAGYEAGKLLALWLEEKRRESRK